MELDANRNDHESYLGIPADIAMKTISPDQLKTPLITTLPANEPEWQSKAVQNILKRVETAVNPIIIVDGGMKSSPPRIQDHILIL